MFGVCLPLSASCDNARRSGGLGVTTIALGRDTGSPLKQGDETFKAWLTLAIFTLGGERPSINDDKLSRCELVVGDFTLGSTIATGVGLRLTPLDSA